MSANEFGDPWTGGNPKHVACDFAAGREFGDPWTGGNPKHKNPVIVIHI